MRWLYAGVVGVAWFEIVTEVYSSEFSRVSLLSQVTTVCIVAVATIVLLDAIKDIKK